MKIIKDKENKKIKPTQCFTYEVVMLVHVVSDDEKIAREQLDEKGGIMTKRDVKLIDSAPLYGQDKE
jgi:hypothetical protein